MEAKEDSDGAIGATGEAAVLLKDRRNGLNKCTEEQKWVEMHRKCLSNALVTPLTVLALLWKLIHQCPSMSYVSAVVIVAL